MDQRVQLAAGRRECECIDCGPRQERPCHRQVLRRDSDDPARSCRIERRAIHGGDDSTAGWPTGVVAELCNRDPRRCGGLEVRCATDAEIVRIDLGHETEGGVHGEDRTPIGRSGQAPVERRGDIIGAARRQVDA